MTGAEECTCFWEQTQRMQSFKHLTGREECISSCQARVSPALSLVQSTARWNISRACCQRERERGRESERVDKNRIALYTIIIICAFCSCLIAARATPCSIAINQIADVREADCTGQGMKPLFSCDQSTEKQQFHEESRLFAGGGFGHVLTESAQVLTRFCFAFHIV